MLVLGAAYQAGAIAVSAEAIEEAIVLNGVSVQMNTHAFRAGRLFVGDPVWAKSLRRRRLGAVRGRPELRPRTPPPGAPGGGPGAPRRLTQSSGPGICAYPTPAE